jgi:dihydrofolate reductase
MKMIAAVDSRWGLGKSGELLTSIPDDMRFFREKTRDRVLVMGRKTLESFPNGKPLSGRLNIVISRANELRIPGVIVCRSIDELLELIADFSSDDVMVIGGAAVYHQLLPYCDAAFITKMQFDGNADVFLDDLDGLGSWSAAEESEIFDYEGLKYSFVEYKNSDMKAIGFSGLSSPMAEYFRLKKEVEFELIDFDGHSDDCEKAYRSELLALLGAFFRPLGNGFSGADVESFLTEREALADSLENYLRRARLIASAEDVAALGEKYDPGKELTRKTISLDKETYPPFAKTISK